MDKDSNKSWDDAKKSALVAQIVSGKLSVKSACERHDLSPETIQDWVRVFRRTTLQAFDEHLRQTFLIQGADAAALGTAEYTGTLDDIPIADLIQTFQLGGKGGVITISRDGQHSQIWCDKGEIIDAECGTLRGEAAMYRILRFERGQVLADFHTEPRERTIEVPGNVLLLEAARRKDESARLLDRLGDRRTIYRPGPAPVALAVTPAEREVLALCDGERSLSAVLEQSEHGDLEILSALSTLVERRQLMQYGVSIAPQSAPLAIAVSKDTPHNGVSFLPLVASQRLEPARRSRAPLAFIGAGMALGAIIWVLASALPRGASHAARDPAPGGAPELEAPATPAFEIDSSVEPRHAELWLDGAKVGVGRLRQELPRDGKPHSLRVVADGYAPTTLLFVDAAPPARIELERLGSSPQAEADAPEDRSGGARPEGEEAVPGAPAVDTDGPGGPSSSAAVARSIARRAAPPPRPKRGAVILPARPPAERAGAVESDEAEVEESSRGSAPRVQIIEGDMPVVQVIE